MKCYSLAVFTGVDLFALKLYLEVVVPNNHSWHQKTRDTGLPDSEDRIPLSFLFLAQYRSVTDRVLFKIAVLAFQCLAGQAPSYLTDDCQLVSDARRRRLRSSDSLTCAVRRTRNTYGDRCFAAAGPRVWNSLPAELRQCDSLKQFKRRLKTYFIGILWDHGAL